MANIEKRKSKDGKISYRVKVRLKGFPGQTATFERLTDARKWGQDTESAIRDRRYFKTLEAQKHTLEELIDRYLEEVMPLKPKSKRDQTCQLNWWKQHLGPYSLLDVTPALIAEYREKLAQGVTPRREKRSASTINRYLAALSHVCTVAAKEWGWLEDNPLRKVAKRKEPRGRVRFLSDDERERLLSACRKSKNPHLYDVVVLALSTGARRMEIWSLRWDQIDLLRGKIILHKTKNDERRALPLTGHALQLIKNREKIRHINSNLVFPGRTPVRPFDFRASWHKAIAEAHIDDFRWHDLRHSTASYLAMNGASPAEIAEVLGHKTLQMVKRYSHLSEQHTSQVVSSMNKMIFG